MLRLVKPEGDSMPARERQFDLARVEVLDADLRPAEVIAILEELKFTQPSTLRAVRLERDIRDFIVAALRRVGTPRANSLTISGSLQPRARPPVAAKLLTRDEARRIAANIAKLLLRELLALLAVANRPSGHDCQWLFGLLIVGINFRGLDDVRLDAELAHAGRHGAAQIIKRTLALTLRIRS
jgi:hypothetical protein